ncbi:hypothetical protein L7F22_066053 [Adiantum nelumboides]|nr:hypothetical protein [Adiantum nelumboides]
MLCRHNHAGVEETNVEVICYSHVILVGKGITEDDIIGCKKGRADTAIGWSDSGEDGEGEGGGGMSMKTSRSRCCSDISHNRGKGRVIWSGVNAVRSCVVMKMENLGGRVGGLGGDGVEKEHDKKAIRSGGRGRVIMETIEAGGGWRGIGMSRGHKLASTINEGFGGGGVVDEIARVGGVGRNAKPECHQESATAISAVAVVLVSMKVKYTNITRLCRTKRIVTVNDQFPGPTITVREGKRVIVNVTNDMPDKNITIHW